MRMTLSNRKLKEIGVIAHYYTKISVAIVNLKDTLTVGEKILIQGGLYPFSTNFEQTVESMQIEHKNVDRAKSGQSIGLKVNNKVKKGDKIFRIV